MIANEQEEIFGAELKYIVLKACNQTRLKHTSPTHGVV